MKKWIVVAIVLGMIGVFDESGNRIGYVKEKKVGSKTYIYEYDTNYRRTQTYKIRRNDDKITVDKFNPVKKRGDEYVR